MARLARAHERATQEPIADNVTQRNAVTHAFTVRLPIYSTTLITHRRSRQFVTAVATIFPCVSKIPSTSASLTRPSATSACNLAVSLRTHASRAPRTVSNRIAHRAHVLASLVHRQRPPRQVSRERQRPRARDEHARRRPRRAPRQQEAHDRRDDRRVRQRLRVALDRALHAIMNAVRMRAEFISLRLFARAASALDVQRLRAVRARVRRERSVPHDVRVGARGGVHRDALARASMPPRATRRSSPHRVARASRDAAPW